MEFFHVVSRILLNLNLVYGSSDSMTCAIRKLLNEDSFEFDPPPLRNDHVIFVEENWVWGMFIYHIIFKLMYSIHIVHVNIRSGVRLDMEIVGFFHLRFYHLPVIEAK